MHKLQRNNKNILEPGNFTTHIIPAVFAFEGLYGLPQKSTAAFHYALAYIYGIGITILLVLVPLSRYS